MGEPSDQRVAIDGKFFRRGAERFNFRGVTYGTFASREDGALYPERQQIKLDLEAMESAGFTVVRTYTLPPDDLLDVAADSGLRVFADVFFPDWRYLIGVSRREQHRVAREARREVEAAARRLAGIEQILALSLGNEIPADVLRWLGADFVADTIRQLSEVVREVDPRILVTYGNYPTAEYLPLPTLDFLTFNVYLERQEDLRRYLTKLQHLAGDRPLVLGEIGMNATAGSAGDDPEGETRQADVLAWQLETAIERGVAGTCVFSWTDEWWVRNEPVRGWHFGLTSSDRHPKPVLSVVSQWNRRTVRDLDYPWPSISVVVCAFNAEDTIDECLRHACALDYPELEIILIDDGSTDATAAIARRHRRARVVTVPHGGLGAARNEGIRQAGGDVVAYLDSDAYPCPEWPYYLALGFDSSRVGGVGGPNLPPARDPVGAHIVARAPGGPVHVLVSDDRAEHVPGCNMAFWKEVLEGLGGFDPIYTAAGDDVDFCWKVLDHDWEIGFHPAALVWHHRRASLGTYLRQQRSYGRSEALVEARNPERFTGIGTARWRGHIYDSLAPKFTRQRIYRGVYGAAAYQSVYQGGGFILDLVHQVGVPAATLLLFTLPLMVRSTWLATPAVLAALFLIGLVAVDTARTIPPRSLRRGRLRFRVGVALHHLLQPLVRTWGRSRSRSLAYRHLPPCDPLPPAVKPRRRGVIVLPEDRPREQLAAMLVSHLRHAKLRVQPSRGWEDYDARAVCSTFVFGDLQTSSHPTGYVQVRVRLRLRWVRLTVAAAVVVVVLAVGSPGLAMLLAALTIAETVRGAVTAPLVLHRLEPNTTDARGG
jgi:glycosyltransferase involved in cell wall biosynthesis